ncbi:MAG: L,D-transpeptidase [Hyphomicrobiaceae bacterium]|nr:L,D-transpeptidase [Hyphomicrobiaceae bacterium]MCC0022976.1 L,D-transpeptidase [Hyphomicrobiaceae bacterium]
MRIRNILARAVALGLALPILAPAAYAAPAQIAFPPPAGMTITTGTPGNGLELRVNATSDPRFLRQLSPYRTSERPGTIVVDTGAHFLYLVLGNGWAMRYGIGVARDGFEWSGTHNVTAKREWPGWTPPAEMRQRQPGLPEYMEGGADNPLGARALYIGSTLYRIHGTNQPWTIGQNVSSGCIRMTNQDVIDLYSRVGVGTKVVVM